MLSRLTLIFVNRRTSLRANANNKEEFGIPSKMFSPIIRSWVIQREFLTCTRVNCYTIIRFITITA